MFKVGESVVYYGTRKEYQDHPIVKIIAVDYTCKEFGGNYRIDFPDGRRHSCDGNYLKPMPFGLYQETKLPELKY